MRRHTLSTPRTRTWRAVLFLVAILLVPACESGNQPTAPVALPDPTPGPTPDPTPAPTLFEFSDFALYVPATVSSTRGILLALGGPDTRAFASGGRFGAPAPQLEASLQALGLELHTLAARHGLAVLGTSLAAMPNAPDSDQLLFDALQEAAAVSGRPDLATAPLLVYGISGGGPQASGFTARNPERVAGLFLEVPAGVESLTEGTVLGVPTFMVLAELDAFVDNAALEAAFKAQRGAGALWALAVEPAVPHHSLTPAHRQLTTHWMSAILDLRLGPISRPLRTIVESSGWLGDPAAGAAAWANYRGDRASASWLPSEDMAKEWGAFVGAAAVVGSLAINPPEFGMSVGETAKLTVTVLDWLGREIPNASVTFTSDHEDVVAVGGEGLVRATAEGYATITATSGGVSATALAFVKPFDFPYILPVKIDPADATISVGERLQLTARVLDPSSGEEIPICSMHAGCGSDAVVLGWSSSAKDVAIVDGRTGVVTGIGKGKATIYATPNGPMPHESLGGWAVITVVE